MSCTDYMSVYGCIRQMCVCWRHIPTLRPVSRHYRFVTVFIIILLFIFNLWRPITQSVIFMLKHWLYITILVHLTEQTEFFFFYIEFIEKNIRSAHSHVWVDSVPRPVNVTWQCNNCQRSFNLLCFCCPLMEAGCS